MTRVVTAAAVALSAGLACAQTATMPPHVSTFTGPTRGYWFTAPVDFRITTIQVLQAPGGANGFMNWAVVRFDGNTPPPNFPTVTNAFARLGVGFNEPSATRTPVSIEVFAGDVIGVYGNTAAASGTTTGVNSYTAASPPGTTTIFGNVVTLARSGMQFHLGTATSPQGMHDIWAEPVSSAISRVEFTYEAIGVTGACCLPSGACLATTQTNCAAQSGIYRGDGTTCPANCPQPPTGACCLPNLTCVITWQGGCTAQGGTYRGDNSVCAGNCPQVWQEQGDAGDLPASAQVVAGSGPVPGIAGSLSAGDADMYRFQICDAANFSANTLGAATTISDTQLFLFDTTGHGVTHDDDDPQGTGGLRSRLSSQFIPSNGEYFIAVSSYNNDPLGAQTTGIIWADTPFNVERRPDGPAAAEAVGSWNGAGAGTGNYTIFLTGSCYISQGPICYPDCDGSHALNVNDFVCFQAAFAANSPQADCDHNTQFNVNDFVCFQSAFAAGCSQL